MTVFDINEEPVGVTYRELLRCGARFCNAFLLVVRDQRELSKDARKVLDDLLSFSLSVERKDRWPGTELLNGNATVYTFMLNDKSIGGLSQSANGLFDWVAPSKPEDLCLLRPNGLAWLTTIAHERDAYLSLSDGEELTAASKVCGLSLERSKAYQ
jgi:hypothetical protein